MSKTFECEQCGRTFPLYVDGQLQPSLGMNLGWGMMHWCKECRPPGEKTVDQIVEEFALFIDPPKEREAKP